MNPNETLQICRMVKSLCPSQAMDQYTPDAWAVVLASCGFSDAKQAIGNLAAMPLEPGKSRYIEPGHIIGEVQRIRAKRLELTPFPEPPAGLDGQQYTAWKREVRDQIAAGTYQPEPTGAIEASPGRIGSLIREARPALTNGTAPERTQPERVQIDDEAAERERQRQLAALEAITSE